MEEQGKMALNRAMRGRPAGVLPGPDTVVPTISIVAPLEGAQIAQDSTLIVRWGVGDNIAVVSVDLDYSVTGAGGPWIAIATGIAAEQFAWIVSATPGATTHIRATARDAAGNAAEAISAAFTVLAGDAGITTNLLPFLVAN